MSSPVRESLYTFGYLVCGAAGGWLNWRVMPVLSPRGFPLAPFLGVGIGGGLIYAGMRLRGFGYGLMMVVLLFFVQLALLPPLRVAAIIQAAMWALPVGLAFMLGGVVFRGLTKLRFGRFLFMAGLVGTGYALAAVLFQLRGHQGLNGQRLWWQFLLGGIMGGALGVLIEVLELIFPLEKYYPQRFRPAP